MLKSHFEPGILSSAQIIPSNTTVSEPNDIMVKFTITNSLETLRQPSFRVTVPESFGYNSACEFQSFSVNLNSKASCTMIGRQAIISNIGIATNENMEG